MSRQFRAWVDHYQNDAWTLARYLLKDAAEAEDATQEAFVKLWHHRGDIEAGKVKPWLMKVTRNTCLDRLRRRRDEVEFQDYGVANETTPADDLERSELGRWLEEKIGALREPYRTLVILRDIHQHSYDEVASATELSLSQVKVYLHRARKELREELAEVRP